MNPDYREHLMRLIAPGYIAHILSIAGFLLALFLVARLMSEKKAPANTFAWLLVIILIPYVGVPLFLVFGGRKLRRLAERKSHLVPTLRGKSANVAVDDAGAVAQTVVSAGGSPPVAGNRLKLLTTGEEEFAALEHHIRQAQDTIHITTFILGRDDTGRRIVALLTEKARQGVKVRLLLDAVGCLLSSRWFVDPLREAGGEVGRFMPVLPFSSPGTANLRNHRKIAIFDHCTAIIGGRNMAREYMGPTKLKKRWVDFGTLIEGPAAALLNEIFIADWSFATKQPAEPLHAAIPGTVTDAKGRSDLQIVASGPDVPGDPLYEGIIAMIQEAKESILIVTPYFIPDDVLLRSLIVKARAGRQVTLVLPSHSNHPITDYARRYYTRELRKAGAKLLLFPDGMMHCKAMVVDERTAAYGSANFDLRSLFVNFEVGVLVHSPAEVRLIKAWASKLMGHCHEARTERQGRRVLGNLAEELCRLLAPLL